MLKTFPVLLALLLCAGNNLVSNFIWQILPEAQACIIPDPHVFACIYCTCPAQYYACPRFGRTNHVNIRLD
jgi:hypothetical protein